MKLNGELPEGFALELLEKELTLEREPCLRLLQDVIGMYSIAIEHYEYVKDPRHFSFQDRLHKLLARPDMQSIAQTPQRRVQRANTQPVVVSSPSNVRRIIQKSEAIIQRSEASAKPSTQKAINDVLSQESDLKRRLAMRNHRKVNTTVATSKKFTFDDDDSLSVSTLEGSPKASEEMQLRIESVLEEVYALKAEKVAEVKVKYQVQMSELEEGPLMEAVKEQMRKKMDLELEEVGQQFDSLRKEKLQQVRETFFN